MENNGNRSKGQNSDVQVWINKIKLDKEDKGDRKGYTSSSEYCIKEGYVAIGYSVRKYPLDWEIYKEKVKEKSGKNKFQGKFKNDLENVIIPFHDLVKKNDLCWARTEDRNYWLGKITDGIWRYIDGTGFDIHNVKKCNWIKIGEEIDNIPLEVIKSLGPGKKKYMIQAEEKETKILSKYLWSKNNGENLSKYNLELKGMDISKLISTYDYEDIIGIYLQKKCDYYIIPSTRGPNTPKYEYEFVKEDNGKTKRAFIQVKTGKSGINLKDYTDKNEYYLFCEGSHYYTDKKELNNTELDEFLKENKNFHILNRDELIKFIYDNMGILPERVTNLLNLCAK